MARTYRAQIMGWDWSGIVTATQIASKGDRFCSEGCDDGGHVGSYYLGSVLSLTPSGKFYMPWTTNQTADDVERDARWYAALEAVATKMGGWIENGEGDPTDLYFLRYWPTPERND
jgi:hypothetical protein